ncbi:hypothetical protein MRB53_011170 [Persea americana]|uniref:Uncharacterized protein n=1 Tax=Persea americana TaxID=3435 RepID=A0ACC2LUP2_PERAE|nr:hypothetical protein MRB53_011170 [Persea americana]
MAISTVGHFINVHVDGKFISYVSLISSMALFCTKKGRLQFQGKSGLATTPLLEDFSRVLLTPLLPPSIDCSRANKKARISGFGSETRKNKSEIEQRFL